MKFFDAHTHVQFKAFDEDREEVIARALESGVCMINVGTQRDTSAAAIKLANVYGDGLWATVGLHPIHTSTSHHDEQELGGGEAARAFTSRGEDFDYDSYKTLASDEKVVAIGECGLDYYRLQEDTKIKQVEVFEKQISLSKEINKPLMIHCREAFDDLISILKTSNLNSIPGVVHFFSGTQENARELMDLGLSFSFGGVTTFAREYEKLIKYIPLERILLETDAPYVAPVPYRGKRNEPVYVIKVAAKISRVKNIDIDEVSSTTVANAKRIFLEKNP